ncbi:tautomerase family protein [Pantoea sp. At-9b]|uniref:tautomerase family protein n=1 Tax=Pantoea sp. (strain At-9b) TaxID=592316 RepID=UPI0001B3E1D3|nr:tautomerase family protein [Pantoea sp. At-9b]ADU71481.1 tautomerase [Pantoea sp. At-9b]
MPFTRILVREGWRDDDLQTLSDTLHEVLVAEFSVPPTDRFQLIESLPAARFIYDRHYLSGGRSDRYVLFSLVAGKSRSTEQKRSFYRVLSERLQQRLDLDPNDVMVVIQQTSAEEWSFSGGEMFDLSMIQ